MKTALLFAFGTLSLALLFFITVLGLVCFMNGLDFLRYMHGSEKGVINGECDINRDRPEL